MKYINQKIGEIPNEKEVSKGELKKVNAVSIVEEETNTGVNKVLGDTIDYLGNAIPSAVYKKYEISLELIKDKIEEKDIGENLDIKKDKIAWEGDLELDNLKELPKAIKFPDSIGGDLNLFWLKELPEDIKFPDSIGGDLNLYWLKELPEDIKFPDSIGGDLTLYWLKELPEDIKFPDHIGGDLALGYLEEISDNIKFPDHIGGDLELRNLKELPEAIKFPDSIGGGLFLNNLEELPDNIKLPNSIGGGLFLNNLEKIPKAIKLPNSIGGSLDLRNLKELPEAIKLPDHIGGNLDLSNLNEIPEAIKLPDHIGGNLNLSNLKEIPEGIKLPESIGGSLDLWNLEELPDNIKFPDHIAGSLNLSNLKEIPEAIKLPDSIGGKLSLGNLEKLPETIKINGDLMLNCNQNLTYLHENIGCKKLCIGNCPKLYTYKNYKIIKYLKDNKKIEEVVGFPTEMSDMMLKIESILSEEDSVVYERFQVLPEDITDRLIEESIYILEVVYESVNGYMLSKRDECIALKETIESITRIEEYKAIDKELDKINKEIKDKPRIVRDRLRSIFSKELWEKVVERVRNKQTDMINFLVLR